MSQHLALSHMDFQRTVIRSRKHLNFSYISALLNKIINKQKTSTRLDSTPSYIRRVTGFFKHLKYLRESAGDVKFGKQSNHFKAQETEIRNQYQTSKSKINQKTLTPALSKIRSIVACVRYANQ